MKNKLPFQTFLRFVRRLSLLAALALIVTATSAQTVWDGGPGGTGTDLNTAANWSTDALPVDGNIARWDGVVAGNLTLNFSTAVGATSGYRLDLTTNQTGSLTLANTAVASQNFRLNNGASISLASGAGAFRLGSLTGSANPILLVLGTVAGGTFTFANSSANVATIGTNVSWIAGGGGSPAATFSGDWNVLGPIGSLGTGLMTKSGTGTLTLSSSNTFTGGITVLGGTLVVGHNKAAGTGMLSMNATGGRLQSSDATARTLANAFTLGVSATFGAVDTGDLTFTGNVNAGAGAKTWTVDGITAEFSGAITNAGGTQTKAGSGTLVLSGNNSAAAGAFVITAGTLKVGNAGALGSTAGATTVSATDAALDLNGTAISLAETVNLNGTGISSGGALINSSGTAASLAGGVVLQSASSIGGTGDMTLGGVISGAFDLTKAGSGVLTLNGNNTYSGTTALGNGTLALGHTNALKNSTLDTGGSGSQQVTFTVAGNNTYNLGGLAGADDLAFGTQALSIGANNASTLYSGVLSGSATLTKVGSGTLTLSNNNTFSSIVVISAGAVRAVNNDALGTAANYAQLTGGGAITSRLELADGVSVAKPFRIGGRVNSAAGLLNVSGDNTLSGNIVLDSGGTDYNVQSDAGRLTLGNITGVAAGAATRNLNLSGAGDILIQGVIANGNIDNPVAVIKSGAGKLTLNGANTYTGGTTVSNGTLVLNATNFTPLVTVKSNAIVGGNGFLRSVAVEDGGLLSPGASVGKLSLTNLTLAATATNVFEFSVAGNTNDIVDVWDLTPGGSVVQVNITGGTLASGSYRLFNYAVKSGSFDSNVVLASGAAAAGIRVQETVANQINLVVNSTPVAVTDTFSNAANVDINIPIATLLANDTDADGDTLQFVSLTSDIPGITNNGVLIHLPGTNIDQSFTYTIHDGFGGTNTGTVNIYLATDMSGQTGSITMSNNLAALTFFGYPGHTYNVERSTNGMSTWQVITNVTASTNAPVGVINLTDDVSGLDPIPASAFYRLVP